MNGFASALAAVGMTFALAAPAYAHAMLDRATPAVGSVVRIAPSQIRLQFSESIEASLSRVSLTDASGDNVQLGAPATTKADRLILVVPVPGPLASGVYRVTWRVVSVDSHVTQGDFSFTVKP